MTTHTKFNDAYASRGDDFEFDDDVIQDEFMPGERICAPVIQNRGSTMLPAALVIVVLLTGAWAAHAFRTTLEPIWTAASSLAWPNTGKLQSRSEVPQEIPAAANSAANTLTAGQTVETKVESRDIAAAPGADAGAPAPETDTASPAGEELSEAAPPERLAPPQIDPADPYQKRAAAVGLHPDLSRALLMRLTPADYRNAGIAIRTAMEADDAPVVVWPLKPQKDTAVFEVRFVHAAAADCRRYVVTVTKDRWQTTAPPMEKCSEPAHRNPGASSG